MRIGQQDTHTHVVVQVTVHPNMSLESEPWSFDLALVRAGSELTFGPKVSPICLPAPDTRELFRQVFVAGWGLMRSKENVDLDPCATNQYGPRKFARCHQSVNRPGQRIACSRATHPSDAK